MAFAPARRALLVHGGGTIYGDLYDDLWELALDPHPTWRQLVPIWDTPDARTGHTLVYDATQDRMILFGGFGAEWVPKGDAYSLSLSGGPMRWTRIAVPDPYPGWGRGRHAAVLDSARQRMLVFGGDSTGGFLNTSAGTNDLWALSLDAPRAWTPLSVSGELPPTRWGHRMIHDPNEDRLVMFGGIATYSGPPWRSPMDDTWALSLQGGSTWQRIATSPPLPLPRFGHSASYDPATRSMVAFGGFIDWSPSRLDTWRLALDGIEHWTPVSGPPAPLERLSAVHDPLRNRMVLLGTNYDDFLECGTLSLVNGRSWLLVPPDPRMPRWGHSAIYDSRRDRIIIFGSNELWALSLSGTPEWTQLVASNAGPLNLASHAAVYDPVRDRMIVLGGTVQSSAWCVNQECYYYSFSGVAMALSLSDLTWSKLAGSDPYPSALISAVYDPVRDRVVVWGGLKIDTTCDPWAHVRCYTTTTSFVTTRALNLSGTGEWEEIAVEGTPPPTIDQTTIYDPRRHRMVVYLSVSRDVWALDLDGTPRWSLLAPTGAPPPSSYDRAAIYDPVGDAMWVYTRDKGIVISKLSWDMPTATLISRVSMIANIDEVSFVWQFSNDPPDSAVVFRRERDTGWIRLSPTAAQESQLAFSDPSVVPGHRYGYRLILWESGRQHIADEAWVEVPQAQEFAMRGVSSNPSPGGLRVSFALSDGSRATLEVVDVLGRRIISREIGALGPGVHEVDLGSDRVLPSGLYFVRLKQGMRMASAKAVIAR